MLKQGLRKQAERHCRLSCRVLLWLIAAHHTGSPVSHRVNCYSSEDLEPDYTCFIQINHQKLRIERKNLREGLKKGTMFLGWVPVAIGKALCGAHHKVMVPNSTWKRHIDQLLRHATPARCLGTGAGDSPLREEEQREKSCMSKRDGPPYWCQHHDYKRGTPVPVKHS